MYLNITYIPFFLYNKYVNNSFMMGLYGNGEMIRIEVEL